MQLRSFQEWKTCLAGSPWIFASRVIMGPTENGPREVLPTIEKISNLVVFWILNGLRSLKNESFGGSIMFHMFSSCLSVCIFVPKMFPVCFLYVFYIYMFPIMFNRFYIFHTCFWCFLPMPSATGPDASTGVFGGSLAYGPVVPWMPWLHLG